MRYDRGTYVSPFAHDAYDAGRKADVPLNAADKLLRKYCDYHLDLQLRSYLLSGAVGEDNLRGMLEAMFRTIFRIFLSKSKDEIESCEHIDLSSVIGYRSAKGDDGGARLGRAGASDLNETFVLGLRASESTCVLELTICLSAAQLLRLESEPKVLLYVMDVFERFVPLHLDYRIRFSVVSEDHTFVLGSEAQAVRLGVTSAILNPKGNDVS